MRRTLMGDAVADTPRGGSAVPTEFTKTAGIFALAASGLWLASLAIIWLGKFADDFDTWIYLVWSASILVAGAFTFVATLGLRQRHETFRRSGTVGLVILGFGVVLSIISWALPLWMTVQGVGMLLVVLAILPKGVAPRAASVAYGSGMLIGAILFGVLTAMKVGSPDQFGDYPLAWDIGITVGLGIVAAGLLGIGTWLRGEQPASVERSDQALIA
jgi:hypothetical protein